MGLVHIRGLRVIAAALAGVMLAGTQTAARGGNLSPTVAEVAGAGAAASPFGLVGSVLDGGRSDQAFTAARLWDEKLNWCDLQPTATADLSANLQQMLGPKIDSIVASGGRRVMLTLGHPAPWVFADHPRARATATRWSKGVRAIWFCDGRASAVAIPDPASLSPLPSGEPSVQQQRFSDYANAVVRFLVQRYGNSLAVDLQVWNEPNLLNGIDPKLRIPGAATTTSQVVASLRSYERIVAGVIAEYPQASMRLVSPSWYQRNNLILRSYLAATNRAAASGASPVGALAFNVYSRRKTPDAMVADWDRRAANLTRLVNRYPNLRRLPKLVTETNHNLNNHKPSDRSNSSTILRSPAVQARLAAATQMNAWFRGYDSVHWLLPMPNQAAVALSLAAENPARVALSDLQRALGTRQLTGCGSVSGTRTCYFADPLGVAGPARVLWRMSGWRTFRLAEDTDAYLTGTRMSVLAAAGTSIRVGTTPVVLSTWPQAG